MKFDAGTWEAWALVTAAKWVVFFALVFAGIVLIDGVRNMTEREQVIFFIGLVVGGVVAFGCWLA